MGDLLASERVREYELIVILSPESTETEAQSIAETVNGWIVGGGGTVGEHDNWGLRRLAFPINKFREGNYTLINFTLSAEAVNELENNLQASQDIMRFLVTRK